MSKEDALIPWIGFAIYLAIMIFISVVTIIGWEIIALTAVCGFIAFIKPHQIHDNIICIFQWITGISLILILIILFLSFNRIIANPKLMVYIKVGSILFLFFLYIIIAFYESPIPKKTSNSPKKTTKRTIAKPKKIEQITKPQPVQASVKIKKVDDSTLVTAIEQAGDNPVAKTKVLTMFISDDPKKAFDLLNQLAK